MTAKSMGDERMEYCYIYMWDILSPLYVLVALVRSHIYIFMYIFGVTTQREHPGVHNVLSPGYFTCIIYMT